MVGQLAIFTTLQPAQLGKVFCLKEGKLHKTVAGQMTEGTYEVKSFTSPATLAALLQGIGTNQAISSSISRTGAPSGRILVAEKAKAAGVLARTMKDFPFKNGPGLLTLDYDPQEGQAALTREELWAKLLQLVPATAGCGAVWWSSGSSFINNGTEGELQGLRGQRLYLLLQDVSDTARAGGVLRDLCWLNGLGRVEISASGSLMKRSLFDENMWQAARLDYIGGSICKPPLFQDRGEPVLMGGSGWLDTRSALPDLTEEQQHALKLMQAAACARLKDESDQVRAAWSATRVRDESKRLQKIKGITEVAADAQASRAVASSLAGTLQGDYLIPLPEGRYVSVKEVLDNWQLWQGKKTLDPLEPEHRGGETCGILYLTGSTPRLFSLAHGGMTYQLARQPVKVVMQRGRQSDTADELAQALCSHGDVFISGGGELVQARNGRFVGLDKAAAQYLLGHRVHAVIRREDREAPQNISNELVVMALAAIGQKQSQTPPTLESVTSLPYATAAGHDVLSAGYSARTGVYNTMQVDTPEIPEQPTEANVIEALKTLWEPWSAYIWASPADRAGMLSAIFTTVLRPAMRTAPGVFLDAPVQGSGKTKAALALGALMTGECAGITPFVASRNQEEEYSKAIVSLLRSERRYWLIDNVTGRFESAALAGLVTSGKVQGRILGLSKEGNFSGRLMLCATGNNATLGSDLHRRFVCCRIDTGVERPTEVSHRFEPEQLALANRMKIAVAVLTVLRAYRQAPPVTVRGGSDFSEWATLVREPIVWLQQQGLTETAGLGEVVDPAKALGGGGDADSDPAREGLAQLLTGLSTSPKLPKQFVPGEVYKAYLAGELRPQSPEGLIREGLESLSNGKPVTGRTIGFTLRNSHARRIDGLRLGKAGKNKYGVLWQVLAD